MQACLFGAKRVLPWNPAWTNNAANRPSVRSHFFCGTSIKQVCRMHLSLPTSMLIIMIKKNILVGITVLCCLAVKLFVAVRNNTVLFFFWPQVNIHVYFYRAQVGDSHKISALVCTGLCDFAKCFTIKRQHSTSYNVSQPCLSQQTTMTLHSEDPCEKNCLCFHASWSQHLLNMLASS